ncbi:hypothetical protein ACTXT7_009880 [Hymenolepis weldensis]
MPGMEFSENSKDSAQPGIIQPPTKASDVSEAPISNVIKESECSCQKNPPWEKAFQMLSSQWGSG